MLNLLSEIEHTIGPRMHFPLVVTSSEVITCLSSPHESEENNREIEERNKITFIRNNKMKYT